MQPLGAFALVITAILNSRISKSQLNRSSIAFCVVGRRSLRHGGGVRRARQLTNQNLVTILIILAVVLMIAGVAFIFLRKRFKAIFYIVAAGVLYGFVATLAKVVINRFQHGNVEGLTFICLIGLLAAAGLGGYFVQNAYASGPPDLVIAGLTVVDPLIAVGIGIIVLGEASQAPPWAAWPSSVAGRVAIWGVFLLAKYHPQAQLVVVRGRGSEARPGLR